MGPTAIWAFARYFPSRITVRALSLGARSFSERTWCGAAEAGGVLPEVEMVLIDEHFWVVHRTQPLPLLASILTDTNARPSSLVEEVTAGESSPAPSPVSESGVALAAELAALKAELIAKDGQLESSKVRHGVFSLGAGHAILPYVEWGLCMWCWGDAEQR
jgi:hypothetical protein